MAALRDTTKFKHLLFMNVMKDYPDLTGKFIDELGRSIREAKDNMMEGSVSNKMEKRARSDLASLSGESIYNGRAFEDFLKKDGSWDYYFESTELLLQHPKVIADVEGGGWL